MTQHESHPRLGDQYSIWSDDWFKVKNKKKEEFSSRLMLHSHTLGFSHPLTKRKVEFIAPIPEDFGEVIDSLERTYSD